MNTPPRLTILLVFLSAAVSASAQAPMPPPALMVLEGEKSEPLKLSEVKAWARVSGGIAETRMAMTFYNPGPRPLAGDLYFPLPEGATISGYGLDVNGTMVEGVVVEKDEARQVFEKEVRKGIDPGLVEWVKGANFKTRVFPIPARGTRTVMVRYLSELSYDEAPNYSLPLNFRDTVDRFTLRVEVIRPAAQPLIKKGGLANFRFEIWQDGWVAETELTNTALTEDLIIALPDPDSRGAAVEESPEGGVTFVLRDLPPAAPADESKPAAPARITLFWDASGSRADSDHAREFGLLTGYFSQWKGASIAVDLVVFRDAAQPPRRFDIVNGDAAGLVSALKEIAYDGGTSMSAIAPSAGASAPDFHLLFSDGLSNFGEEEPKEFRAPVYAFSADSKTNHSFLRYLALTTGGGYFNLKRLVDADIIAGIGKAPYSFIRADVERGETEELYPQVPQPIHGRFMLAGKLKSPEATVTLRYGLNGKVLRSSTFTVSRKDAAKTDLLRMFWAQKKIDDLGIFPARNKDALIETGRKHGMVTPGTSLLVLESLEQYVEHRILPPKSLADMRSRYIDIVEKTKKVEDERRQGKIDAVLAMWRERVAWWEKEYKVPAGFRYQEAGEQFGGARGGALRGARFRHAEASPPSPSAMPEPRPAPEMAEQSERSARAFADARGDEAMASQEALSFEGGAAGASSGGGGGSSGDSMDRPKASGAESGSGDVEPEIALKPWNPDTPYLAALKAVKPEGLFAAYIKQRKEYALSPAFYLDCADFLFEVKQDALAMQVLSNIAELDLENPALLRVLGHRLAQQGRLQLARLVFEEVKRLRPEEPQSYRDLAMVLVRLKEYAPAVELLYHVVLHDWDRFQEIELIALIELNRALADAKQAGVKTFPVDPRLVKKLDMDVRVVLTWDADLTDIDLWVTEPSGEKAMYSHNRTTIGGLVSKDFTGGYGPEEYLLRRAMKGEYSIEANYYGSSAQSLIGAVTLQADVYTNFGRPNEKRRSITLRLKEAKDVVGVGKVAF